MKRILAGALVAAVVSAAATGQSFYMPSNTPTTGTCNTIPFGQTSFIYQTLASGADLGNSATLDICELAFTPCSGTGVIHFDTIEITLAQTAVAPLSTTFTANLVQNPQVVLSATNYDWHVTANQWNRMGLDKSYQYIAGNHPNLVVQIVATGVSRTGVSTSFHRDGTHQRVYALNWAGSPPPTGSSSTAALKFEISVGQADLNAFGVGCAGSNGVPAITPIGDGKINGSFGIDATNCVANAPLLHVFGLTRFEPRVNLAIIGAPNCFLYETLDVMITGVASGTGTYSWRTSIPNDPNLVCLRVYTQIAPADRAANPWGNTTSNYVRLLAGN